MATNKFATMLHRNTNKITLILIYALLEWTLITLLLVNSLFSYLIIKFADFFGLKPPCLWCSRVDHFFEPEKKTSHRDLLCEVHATEVSELGYCSNHRKLALCQHMCENCSSSRPDFDAVLKKFTPFPWDKRLDVLQSEGDEVNENVEVSFKCSCCGVSIENRIYPTYDVIRPPRDVLEYSHEGNLIIDSIDGNSAHEFENKNETEMLYEVHEGYFALRDRETEDCSVSLSLPVLKESKGNQEKETTNDDNSSMITKYQISDEATNPGASSELIAQNEDFSDHRPVRFELINSKTEENQRENRVEEEQETSDHKEVNLVPQLNVVEAQVESVVEKRYGEEQTAESLSAVHENTEEPTLTLFGSMENEVAENSSVSHGEDVSVTKLITFPRLAINDVQESTLDVPQVYEETPQNPTNETDSEVSIGTEIPDLDITNIIQPQVHDDPTTTFISFHEKNRHDHEEEKVPDTPTSIESFKKLGLLERKESGTEESFDGSIISELEGGGDGVLTVERLASALRAERKNLQTLYMELEEERSASAIAANQTMAMINRLQEEKAAMQMEALQYQRMMEEQSEYDQEALQLMNELVVKREKEKQELERELEIYRRKVFDYEAGENIRIARTSSCSTNDEVHEDDNDGLYVDLDQDLNGEDGFRGNGELYTPHDTVVHLEESLGEFEEERDSIIEELRVLESKLFSLGDKSDQEHFHHKEMNGFSRRIVGSKPKRLLPLFDAISKENADGLNGNENENQNGFDLNTATRFKGKRDGIEEEVDQLNQRLQALEADKEFLKHCISSLKKGDKGIDLLQEILQHLRDLRNVELQVKHF